MEIGMRQLLKVMKALGDGTRVKIFKLLQHRTLCVCELTSVLGLSQSAVSKNLKLLEDAGLVTFERQGSWINYRLADGDNPYAAAATSHLKEWLEDDPAIRSLLARAQSVDRLAVCGKQGLARDQRPAVPAASLTTIESQEAS
jgi:ArsR family transcriptional regulator